MLEKFVPDKYYQSIYSINYKALKKAKIKCLIFDLDNTLAPVSINNPTSEVKELMEQLKELDFKVIIMSNSNKRRIEPFKNSYGVDASAMSLKPLSIRYKKIMRVYKLSPSEIAAIGDQLVTDIYGANRLGLLSILVNPISNYDKKITSLNRFLERKILTKLEKKDLFTKGEYYD